MKRLEEEGLNLSPAQFEDPLDIDRYRDHLDDLAAPVYAAKALGDELSILSLYNKVEAHTGRVVKKKVQAAATASLSYFKQLCNALPFGIKMADISAA